MDKLSVIISLDKPEIRYLPSFHIQLLLFNVLTFYARGRDPLYKVLLQGKEQDKRGK